MIFSYLSLQLLFLIQIKICIYHPLIRVSGFIWTRVTSAPPRQIHYPPYAHLSPSFHPVRASPISRNSQKQKVQQSRVFLTPEKTQVALKEQVATTSVQQPQPTSVQNTPRSAASRTHAPFSTGLRQNGYLNSSFRRSTARSQSFRSRPFSAGTRGNLLLKKLTYRDSCRSAANNGR